MKIGRGILLLIINTVVAMSFCIGSITSIVLAKKYGHLTLEFFEASKGLPYDSETLVGMLSVTALLLMLINILIFKKVK